MTEYRVVFANATPSSINIQAETVNLGRSKLWFYDAEDRLIAVYRWDHIVGFDVVGSAAEQAFTDSLLHETRRRSAAGRAQAIEEQGTVIVLLEDALGTLRRATEDLRTQWIQINDESKNKTQMALLAQSKEGKLRELQAGLIDGNRELQKVLGHLQTEFKNMGIVAPVVNSDATPLGALSAEPQGREKKKKWSF